MKKGETKVLGGMWDGAFVLTFAEGPIGGQGQTSRVKMEET